MGDRWQLNVDAGKCVGSGLCSANAPAHFALRDGVSVPLAPEIDADDTALQAAQTCPAEAIRVRSLASGEVLAGDEDG